ncbi:Eukaryotic translation initiation factor 2 subunit beta [Bienertia sinuspersici]
MILVILPHGVGQFWDRYIASKHKSILWLTVKQRLQAVDMIPSFDPTMKKKKKKKEIVIQHHVDDSLYSSADREDILPSIEGGRNVFVGSTKKKRSVGSSKLLDNISDAAEDMCDSDEEDEEEDALVQRSRYHGEGNERDYEYKELLRRVFSFLHAHNPQLAEDKRRTVLRPPLVLPEGTTKTVFVNFMDLCQT